jgi:hypothetical protein
MCTLSKLRDDHRCHFLLLSAFLEFTFGKAGVTKSVELRVTTTCPNRSSSDVPNNMNMEDILTD